MSTKRSPIWDYFKVGEDTKFAVCNVCGQSISRGGKTTKTFNTTNLVYHIRGTHAELHSELLKKCDERTKEKASAPSSSRQLTLQESSDKARKWDINDPRAQHIHTRIAEMIALDYQPFSIVDDVGFVRLLHSLEPRYVTPSRRYVTETVMPKIYETVRKQVKVEIAGVSHISFTSDLWSTTVSVNSLMSLTAHWLTETFDRKRAILHVQPFDGSHTGDQIRMKFEEMFNTWKIKEDQIHLVLCDNGSNMVKALTDASLPHYGCFAHTLQLVVNDGVLSQRAVIDILSSCRKIVGHFRHSCLAYSRLRVIQENLGLPQHRLIQDEPTRWNSSLYMLQRILEQKMAFAAYATEHMIIQLNSYQLELVAKIVAALSPIEEVTKSISTDAASISVVLPFVRILSKTLSQHHDDSGVRTMKNEMKTSLQRRFADAEENEKLLVATILDPRFKEKFFSGPVVTERAKSRVQDKISSLNIGSKNPNKEPSPKRPCTGLWKTFSDILEEAGASVSSEGGSQELDAYLAEPLITFGRESCYSWWANNRHRFPCLVKVARQYLCAPPTSVASERLFSGAGDVYDDKRKRLAPEKAEMLLFIKNNFSLI